jgi:hypothetical protein
MNFGVHPFILIAAAGVLAAVVAVFMACRARSAFATGLLAVLALLFLAPAVEVFLSLHPELADARYRTYRSFYRDLRPGLTRAQVLDAMARHYPAGGPRVRPTIDEDTPQRLSFFMNPETSREPNCEGIVIILQDGLATRIFYSED